MLLLIRNFGDAINIRSRVSSGHTLCCLDKRGSRMALVGRRESIHFLDVNSGWLASVEAYVSSWIGVVSP